MSDASNHHHARDPWDMRCETDDTDVEPESLGRPTFFTPGHTFYESYMSGELSWPRESLYWGNDGDDTVTVNEYLTHIDEIRRAEATGDHTRVRRLRGEIEAAEHEFDQMDAYQAAATFRDMRVALATRSPEPTPTKQETASVETSPPVGACEDRRFSGPAPFYRRGRIYAQAVAQIAQVITYATPFAVAHHKERADQLLRAVEATNDPQALQDFIAGVVREIERQLALHSDSHALKGWHQHQGTSWAGRESTPGFRCVQAEASSAGDQSGDVGSLRLE